MKATRAISKYLTDNISGLYAFKDDLAFTAAGNPYPYFLSDIISTQKKDLGCGIWDQTIDNRDGTFTQSKIIKKHVVIRFTIRAVNDTQQNGNDIVSAISDEIDRLLRELCRYGSADLTDAVSGECFHIESSVFQDRSDIAPIENKIPFIYQQSLSYKLVIGEVITKVVTTPISNVNVSF